MTTRILRAPSVAGLVAAQLQTAYRRFLGCATIETIELSTTPHTGATLVPLGETRREEGSRATARVLALSASRAYDSALDILGAYKLTGNFHINLEIVLKDLGAFDKVMFEVEPRAHPGCWADRRHVLFRPRENVHIGQFSEIIHSIKSRIGFDGTRRWWSRAFH